MTTTPLSDPVRTRPSQDAYDSTLRFLSDAARTHVPSTHHPVPTGASCVRDVMTEGVVAAHEGARFKDIVRFMLDNGVRAVPVVDSDHRVLGVVSESDLLYRLAETRGPAPRGHWLHAVAEGRRKVHALTAADLMTAPAFVASPHMPIPSAAWHAARCRVHQLPVVDDDGVLVGIVSRGDLLRPYLRGDDEIRDDIVENVVRGTFVLDPNTIDVAVEHGVVTLRGTVPTRTIAEELTADVHGVTGVVEVFASALGYKREE